MTRIGASTSEWDLPEIEPIRREDVQRYVNDEEWQRIRVSMKGMSTADKLDTLEAYWWNNTDNTVESGIRRAARRVRIINYLTALKRGGQLSNETVPRIQR